MYTISFFIYRMFYLQHTRFYSLSGWVFDLYQNIDTVRYMFFKISWSLWHWNDITAAEYLSDYIEIQNINTIPMALSIREIIRQ